MRPHPSRSRLAPLVDALSFDAQVRDLVDALRHEMAAPRRHPRRLPSHPFGFVREVSSRRLTIAEHTITLASTPGPEGWEIRLSALKDLAFLAWHAKTLSMPLNTARVQVALIKACLEQPDDRRAQLERMSDFALASYGSVPVIRRMLRELGLLEVPERGLPLSELDLGWDDHVHDALTEGHKTPSQLLLDAFIRGISRLTVVYYDLEDPRIHAETLEAGEILGIRAEVGVEFSVGRRLDRVNYLWIPPGADRREDLDAFLRTHADDLAPFFEGLRVNRERREAVVHGVLDRFNETALRELNAAYADHPFLQVQPLSWSDLEEMLHGGRASRLHVGALLAARILPVFHRRVLYHKNQLRAAEDTRGHGGNRASWEVQRLRERYLEVRRAYEACTPTLLQERYLPSRDQVDYDSAFVEPATTLDALSRLGGRLVLIHPLSRGLERAAAVLVDSSPWLTDVEVFNMADAAVRDPEDLRGFARFVSHLSAGRPAEAARLLAEAGVRVPPGLEAATARYAGGRLRARCGTDYVGRKDRVPGLGFLRVPRSGPLPQRLRFLQRHATLPDDVAASLSPPGEPPSSVSALSPPVPPRPNPVGDEHETERIGLRRTWRYLHPNLRMALKVLVGFVPASLVVGPAYALLWFLITGSRNVVVDLVASAGGAIRAWRPKAIDRENLANSLFWTGFSVPVMAAAKAGFDLAWPLVGLGPGFLEALARFWFIALANGTWLWSHNRLRGFDPAVARGNFFRSVLSWPLATLGSLGLDLVGIPSIVQAKFWSDVVAGLIEGTGKSRQRKRLSQRTFLELFRGVLSPDPVTRLVARADILFVWAFRPGGRQALAALLAARPAPGGGPEANPERVARVHGALVRDFGGAGSLAALTGLLLQHHEGRDAAHLAGRLAAWHEPFVQFLRRFPLRTPEPPDPRDPDP